MVTPPSRRYASRSLEYELDFEERLELEPSAATSLYLRCVCSSAGWSSWPTEGRTTKRFPLKEDRGGELTTRHSGNETSFAKKPDRQVHWVALPRESASFLTGSIDAYYGNLLSAYSSTHSYACAGAVVVRVDIKAARSIPRAPGEWQETICLGDNLGELTSRSIR